MTDIPKIFESGKLVVCGEDVKALFKTMKRDSGSGHPWTGLGKTKGEIIDKYPQLLIEAVITTLHLWCSTEAGTLSEDPCDLVKLGFSSPMRTFVKNEPHGHEKLTTGRVRLIIMVPMHLVLAEMLIHGTQNNVEIAHWDEIPSKPGLGLAEDSHIRKIDAEVRARTAPIAEADVSGFDFSLCDEFFRLDACRRVILAGAKQGTAFYNAVFNSHHVMNRAVFALSDGVMIKQLTPGIMKSGRYVTSSTNSFIRVLLAHAVGSKWCIAMGDDSLEEVVPNAIDRYRDLGVKVKFYNVVEKEFEFCSHTFANGTAYPSKPGKMFYNLLNQRGTSDVLIGLFQQWFFEMRHHPDVDQWVNAIERSGWGAQNDGKERQQEESSAQEW